MGFLGWSRKEKDFNSGISKNRKKKKEKKKDKLLNKE